MCNGHEIAVEFDEREHNAYNYFISNLRILDCTLLVWRWLINRYVNFVTFIAQTANSGVVPLILDTLWRCDKCTCPDIKRERNARSDSIWIRRYHSGHKMFLAYVALYKSRPWITRSSASRVPHAVNHISILWFINIRDADEIICLRGNIISSRENEKDNIR